jgi:hypothetical protein
MKRLPLQDSHQTRHLMTLLSETEMNFPPHQLPQAHRLQPKKWFQAKLALMVLHFRHRLLYQKKNANRQRHRRQCLLLEMLQSQYQNRHRQQQQDSPQKTRQQLHLSKMKLDLML